MKLNVFVSSQKDGIMSKDKKFFPNLSTEERELLYKTTLTRFFERRNIKYEDVVVLPEKNTEIKSKSRKRFKFLLVNRKILDFQKEAKCYRISLDNILNIIIMILDILQEKKNRESNMKKIISTFISIYARNRLLCRL